jgi:hypothetical protein
MHLHSGPEKILRATTRVSPKHHTPSGRGPVQAFDLAGWWPPTVARQACSPHATSTHKKTKKYEFFELFFFSLPKAVHFLSFLGIFNKISLTSSTLKEWQGFVGWHVKACFWRAGAKILCLTWTGGSPKKSYSGSGRPKGSWCAPMEVL